MASTLYQPIIIQLGMAQNKDELQIYSGDSGALLSWKAAKCLLSCYPCIPSIQVTIQINIKQTIAPDTWNPGSWKSVSDTCLSIYNTIPSNVWWPNLYHGRREIPHYHWLRMPCHSVWRHQEQSHMPKQTAELDLMHLTHWCTLVIVTSKKGHHTCMLICWSFSSKLLYQMTNISVPNTHDTVVGSSANSKVCTSQWWMQQNGTISIHWLRTADLIVCHFHHPWNILNIESAMYMYMDYVPLKHSNWWIAETFKGLPYRFL